MLNKRQEMMFNYIKQSGRLLLIIEKGNAIITKRILECYKVYTTAYLQLISHHLKNSYVKSNGKLVYNQG